MDGRLCGGFNISVTQSAYLGPSLILIQDSICPKRNFGASAMVLIFLASAFFPVLVEHSPKKNP